MNKRNNVIVRKCNVKPAQIIILAGSSIDDMRYYNEYAQFFPRRFYMYSSKDWEEELVKPISKPSPKE